MSARILSYPVVFVTIFLMVYAILIVMEGLVLYNFSAQGAFYSVFLEITGLMRLLVVPTLFIFFGFLRYSNLHSNLLLTEAVSGFGIALPTACFFKATRNPETMAGLFGFEDFPFPPHIPEPGPGLLVLASALVAWLVIFKVTAIWKYF